MKKLRKISIAIILLLSINIICPIINTNAVTTLLSTYTDYVTFKNDLQSLGYPLSITVNTAIKEPNMATYNKYKLVVYGYLAEFSTKKDVYGEYEYLGWNRYGTPQPNSKYNDTGSGSDGFDTCIYVTTDMSGNDISNQATLSWKNESSSEYFEYNKNVKLSYNGSGIGLTVNQIGTNKAILYQQATLISEGSVRVYFTDRNGSNKRYATLTIPTIPFQNILRGSLTTNAKSYTMSANQNAISVVVQANAQINLDSKDGTDKFFKDIYIYTLTAKATKVEINGKVVYSAYTTPPTFDDDAYGTMLSKTFNASSTPKTILLNRNLFTTGAGQRIRIYGYMSYTTLQNQKHTIDRVVEVDVNVEPQTSRSLTVNYIDSTGKPLGTSQTINNITTDDVPVPMAIIPDYKPIKYVNITKGIEELYSSKPYNERVLEGQNIEVAFVYNNANSSPTPTVTASATPTELKADIGSVKVDVLANALVSNYTSSTTPRITNLALYCEPEGESGKGQTHNLGGSNTSVQKLFTFDINTSGKTNNEKQEFNVRLTVTYANGTTATANTTTNLTFKSDSNIILSVTGSTRNSQYLTGDIVRIEIQSTGTIENKFDEATQSAILFVKQMPVGWKIGDAKTYITSKSKKRSSQVPANSTGTIDGTYSDFAFDVNAENQAYTQYFEITLATIVKDKVYIETNYISTEIYKGVIPPIINTNKPSTTVNVNSIVFVGSSVLLSGYGNDNDANDKLQGALVLDGVQIDSKESATNSISLSKDWTFLEEGKHNLSMYVLDQGGNLGIDSKDFQVVVPSPTLVVKTNRTYTQLGDVKVNRKYNIDISISYAGSSSAFINWNRTTWKVEPYQNIGQLDIKKKQPTAMDGDKPYPQSFSVLSKKDGKYKVTITIENNYGKTDTKQIIVEVSPDTAPIAILISDKSILRDPATGYATFNLMDNTSNGTGQYSFSDDYDDIVKRAWVYAYDDNGNGSYTDDNWYIYNASSKTWMLISNNLEDLLKKDVFSDIYSCGNENNVQVITKYVGDYRMGLFVKEGYGQPTINEFITSGDYLTDNTIIGK